MEEVSGNAVVEGAVSPGNEDNGLVSKQHVTDLVKREKEAAYRKAQREFQAQLDEMKTGQTQSMGGMQQVPENMVEQAVERKLQQKLSELQEQHEAQTQEQRKADRQAYVNDQAKIYLDKMDKSGDMADDFQEMTARFKPDKFPEIFFLANKYDSTPAIVYELGKYPEKLLEIDRAMERDPDLAKVLMDNLANSIKFNQEAKQNNKSAEPPLSRPKPSLAAGADSGAMTLADLKKSKFLRG
jgi:hypothetical protein